MEFRLLSLYPDQMNIYADRGNIIFLRNRCEWRGIEFELTECGIGEEFEPDRHDMIYMGGGQDRDQRVVAGDLVEIKREAMSTAHSTDVVMLAVCGGYQLLGSSYELDGEQIEGLGLVDLKTVREPGKRLIGPVAVETELDGTDRVLAGFENHGGHTTLGPEATPLGRVLAGHGNNGKDGFEGVRAGNLIGTYLHGPLLPKNAWLADHLILSGLRSRYGEEVELAKLRDGLEEAAHQTALAAALKPG